MLKTLRTARRDEGFAVPTALMMLLAVTAVVSVGLMSSIRAQSGTERDQETKSALPQAEGGISQALLHFNRIAATTNVCSPVTSSSPNTAGWCGPITGGFDGGTYTTWVRPESTAAACGSAVTDCVEFVSTGNYDGVTRKVHATAHSSSGSQIFFDAGVKSQDSIQMDSNAEIHSGTATNGNINLNSNAKQCGQASVGVGKHMTQSSNAQYTSDQNCLVPTSNVIEQPLNLPPVNQGDVVTVNDNGRFFSQDPISGATNRVCWNGVKGNGTSGSCGARHLDLISNSAITLGGGKYSFCKLTMESNTALYIAAGKTVTIYFDTPESCGYSSGTEQMNLASNARITSTTGGPANAALLFVGSSTRQTNIHLSSNTSVAESCSQNFVVYAPRTDITINSNAVYCGAVAGKTIHMDSNARLFLDNDADNFYLPATEAHYEVDRFVECTTTSATSGSPDTGC